MLWNAQLEVLVCFNNSFYISNKFLFPLLPRASMATPPASDILASSSDKFNCQYLSCIPYHGLLQIEISEKVC